MAARVLVAYATKLGSNGEIAEVIADALRAAGHHATAQPVREVMSLDDWDAVVLGSALYAAHWQRDARRFTTRFREALAARPLWLFSSGPLDPRLAKADLPITAHGAEVTAGLGAIAHHTFGGRLLADAPVDPQVLATHPIGDFRSWDAIRAYAVEIGDALAEMSFALPEAPEAPPDSDQ
jgi:menaquinone-dependent protoporphyrinogen oxidase